MIDFVTKKRAGFTGRSNLEIKTQPWVGGTSLLLVFGPFGVMRRKPELKSRCIDRDALARGSITTPAPALIQIDASAVSQAVYAALWLLAPS